MKLYHGSNVKIEKIDLTKSKVGKDFGRGFYLSPTFEQAQELSIRKVSQLGCGEPIITAFEIDDLILTDGSLKVLRFDSYSREWAEFILRNRRNLTTVQAHDYDVVIGPIANDAVGVQLRKFTSGLIDIDRLLNELKYMKGITIQYFFSSQRAINFLKPIQL